MEGLVKNFYEPNKLLIHIQNRSLVALGIRNQLRDFYSLENGPYDIYNLSNSGNHVKCWDCQSLIHHPFWTGFTLYFDHLKYGLSACSRSPCERELSGCFAISLLAETLRPWPHGLAGTDMSGMGSLYSNLDPYSRGSDARGFVIHTLASSHVITQWMSEVDVPSCRSLLHGRMGVYYL